VLPRTQLTSQGTAPFAAAAAFYPKLLLRLSFVVHLSKFYCCNLVCRRRLVLFLFLVKGERTLGDISNAFLRILTAKGGILGVHKICCESLKDMGSNKVFIYFSQLV